LRLCFRGEVVHQDHHAGVIRLRLRLDEAPGRDREAPSAHLGEEGGDGRRGGVRGAAAKGGERVSTEREDVLWLLADQFGSRASEEARGGRVRDEAAVRVVDDEDAV